jgi:hypothetical protein
VNQLNLEVTTWQISSAVNAGLRKNQNANRKNALAAVKRRALKRNRGAGNQAFLLNSR